MKKEGEDFLLCDACDGGMHRQCALLDKVPEGFWACFSCQRQPTVDSAIRQASHHMHVGKAFALCNLHTAHVQGQSTPWPYTQCQQCGQPRPSTVTQVMHVDGAYAM